MLPIEAVQPAIHLAIELSSSAWLVAVHSPAAEKVSLHRMKAGDVEALLSLIALLRSRAAAAKLGIDVPVASCFEAGRDGFRLRRVLGGPRRRQSRAGAGRYPVNRRARRAKTDRLDAEGRLRVLAAHRRGDRRACRVVRVPTTDEGDAKRQHRERGHPVREKVRIENRIEASLATQGVRKRPSLRTYGPETSRPRAPVTGVPSRRTCARGWTGCGGGSCRRSR